MTWLVVGCGGIVGALLRYQVGRWVDLRQTLLSFPLATLLINVTGSFILGLLTSHAGLWWPGLHSLPILFFGTGVCGAYTTFSTFSYEAVSLAREGKGRLALIYIVSSFIFCTAASGVGLFGFSTH